MLAPPNAAITYPKRQITDEERHRLGVKMREITTVKQAAKKTPDGYPIPGSAIIEYVPGWDDAATEKWINDQGPFFNGKGQKVPPLNVHAITAHRHRTVGRLFKKAPNGKKGPKKSDLLARIESLERDVAQLNACWTNKQLNEIWGRLNVLEDNYTRPSDH